MAANINTIVTAVDLDDDLVNAILKTAVDLSKTFEAVLHVVNVVTPMKGFETLHAMDAVTHDVEAHQKAGAERLKQLTSLVSKLTPSAKPIVLQGHPGEAVADYARKNDADLLVIGSHQKGWWETLTSGAASPEPSVMRSAPSMSSQRRPPKTSPSVETPLSGAILL